MLVTFLLVTNQVNLRYNVLCMKTNNLIMLQTLLNSAITNSS